MNKFLKTTIGWVFYLAILVGLVWGTPKALSLILHTNFPMASITSGSMWPALQKGDLILIKGVAGKEDLKLGDIVVYQNPKGFTIHRIIKLGEDTLTTKGDANNVEDAPISYQELVGKTLTFKEKIVRIPFLGQIGLLINKSKINAK